MVELNGFSAWVVVDGTELPEYGYQTDLELKQVTCWIPSQAGKEFTVCWKDPVGLVGTAGYLSVDGTPCGAKHMYSLAQRPFRRVDTIRKGAVSTSETTERPLSFAQIDLTDNESYLDVQASPHLGDIRLDIFEVKIEQGTRFVQPGMPPDQQLLHERTKKAAVQHRVKLGDEASCPEKKFVSLKKIRHLCAFVFRYRPFDVLKANGIMPLEKTLKRAYEDDTFEFVDLTEDFEEHETKKVKLEDVAARQIKVELDGCHVKSEAIETGSAARMIKAEIKDVDKVLYDEDQLSPYDNIIDLT
ncbi:hypothetical protein H0H92_014297 [Tricholoma furcatifolium]|nr:hypothetical protein H0H92_014297 [Tricholoma furcatifolium]